MIIVKSKQINRNYFNNTMVIEKYMEVKISIYPKIQTKMTNINQKKIIYNKKVRIKKITLNNFKQFMEQYITRIFLKGRPNKG